MCSNPQTGPEGEAFACRVCNDCLKTRKNDWVARCMAEKHSMGHALVITLTYRDDHEGVSPDGAKLFRYQHVQTFLKRLRNKYFDQYQARSEISYICAGERGSKKGRVHWHLVVFSSRPLVRLGFWQTLFGKVLPNGPRIGVKKAMDLWDLWEHGAVNVLEPDQKGMAYVLKYALKAQFSAHKSHGTMRAAKSENNAAGMFRMSKKPAIGDRFLAAKLVEWRSKFVVPVKPHIRVPGYSGFWWPKGRAREIFLTGLHGINQASNRINGRDCPQWAALLSSVSNSNSDWEALTYGRQEQEPEPQGRSEREITRKEAAYQARQRTAETIQRCGGASACEACQRGFSEAQARLHAAYLESLDREIIAAGYASPVFPKARDEYVRARGELQPYCAEFGTSHFWRTLKVAGYLSQKHPPEFKHLQRTPGQCESADG